MEAPTTNREKAPHGGLKLRVPEENTVRNISGYKAQADCVEDSLANKIDRIANLLRKTRELVCMLLAIRDGATRFAPCEHMLVKRYPPGMRDNNEYDWVCSSAIRVSERDLQTLCMILYTY